MNYRYDIHNQTYFVTELTTDLVIAHGLHKSQAVTLTKRLNSGNGFNGWTPEFFLRNIPVSDSPDDIHGGNEWIDGWSESKWTSDPK